MIITLINERLQHQYHEVDDREDQDGDEYKKAGCSYIVVVPQFIARVPVAQRRCVWCGLPVHRACFCHAGAGTGSRMLYTISFSQRAGAANGQHPAEGPTQQGLPAPSEEHEIT